MAKQKVIGIDLGTTNSVVCYKDESGKNILIKDEKGRTTHPSVITVNNKGDMLFSYNAKNRADREPAPIFFIKRQMGRAYEAVLDKDKKCTPVEVSAYILTYLKKLAEKQLEESISRAVITVPAHFDLPARQATIEAGESAGFKVEELLIEPVAAALAYGMESKDENCKVLVYDLGGGTFDVNVLEKRSNYLISKGWAGNNMLGGSNFDKDLANLILNKIRDEYTLSIDLENPEQKAKWYYLLTLAEMIKIKLSDFDQAEIRIRGEIKDDDGDSISIEDVHVTKDEFVSLLKGSIDSTMELTQKALTEANLTKKDIDEVILVGASTYIPYVQERLKEEFLEKNGGGNQQPEQYKPDHCISIGAALKASYLDVISVSGSGSEEVSIRLSEKPQVTSDTEFSISGKIDIKDSSIAIEKTTIKLLRKDGGESYEANLNNEGGFFIDNIELVESFNNEFVLKLFDNKNKELASEDFSVEQNPDKDDITTDEEYLNKPIHVLTEAGMVEILKAGESIPATNTKSFKKTDQDWIIVKVLDGTLEIGEIPINTAKLGIPEDTSIDITINFSKDYKVYVKVEVPTYNINEKGEFRVFYKDAPSTKTVDEIKSEFKAIKTDFEECMNDNRWKKSDSMRNKKLDNEDMGLSLVEEIERGLHIEDGIEKDPQAVIDPKDIEPKSMEFKGLLEKMHLQLKGLKPSFEDFGDRVKNAKRLIKEISAAEKLEGEDDTLRKIEGKGKEIYDAMDKDGWAKINNELNELVSKLEGKRPPIKESEIPPTPYLKKWALEDVDKTEDALKDSNMPAQEKQNHLNSLSDARREIESIPNDMDKMEALYKIQGVYQKYERPVVDALRKGDKVCYKPNCKASLEGDGRKCVNGHDQIGITR